MFFSLVLTIILYRPHLIGYKFFFFADDEQRPEWRSTITIFKVNFRNCYYATPF